MRQFALVVAALTLGGCASYESEFFRFADELPRARPAGAPVEIFADTPTRAHRDLGMLIVSSRDYRNMERLRAVLGDEARKSGADAVKNIRVLPASEFRDYYWYGGFCYPYRYGYFGSDAAYVSQRWDRTFVMGVAIAWEPEEVARSRPRFDARFFRFIDRTPLPRPRDARIEIVQTPPERDHLELGTIVVSSEKGLDMDGMRAALLAEARHVGADAVRIVRIAPSGDAGASRAPGKTAPPETAYLEAVALVWRVAPPR
jgi:hypothetical protein